MFAKLAYDLDSTRTAEDVLDDIADLLTGEEDINTLAAKGNNLNANTSYIDSTFSSVAYTLVDDWQNTDRVFEVQVHDDPVSNFYMHLFTSGSDIDIKLWDTWDSLTHSGTGSTYYATTGFEFCTVSNTFTLYISAMTRHCLCRSEYLTGSKRYMRGFMQYTRGEQWDTVTAGSKPAGVFYGDNFGNNTIQFYTLAHTRSDGSRYSFSGAYLYPHVRYGSCQNDPFNNILGGTSGNARGLNATLDSIHNMYEFGFSFVSSGERFLTGPQPNVYLATYLNGGFGDEITIEGLNYIVWEATSSFRIAVRKG